MGSLSDIVSSSIGGGVADPSVQTDQQPVPINTYDAIFGTPQAVAQAQQNTVGGASVQTDAPQGQHLDAAGNPISEYNQQEEDSYIPIPNPNDPAERYKQGLQGIGTGQVTPMPNIGEREPITPEELAQRRMDAGLLVDNSKDNYYPRRDLYGKGDANISGSDSVKGSAEPAGMSPKEGKRSPAMERMMRDAEKNIKAGMARRLKEKGMI